MNRALKRKEQDEKDDARKENRRKNQSNVSISGGFFKNFNANYYCSDPRVCGVYAFCQ